MAFSIMAFNVKMLFKTDIEGSRFRDILSLNNLHPTTTITLSDEITTKFVFE